MFNCLYCGWRIHFLSCKATDGPLLAAMAPSVNAAGREMGRQTQREDTTITFKGRRVMNNTTRLNIAQIMIYLLLALIVLAVTGQ
jgi:hypothetical protein